MKKVFKLLLSALAVAALVLVAATAFSIHKDEGKRTDSEFTAAPISADESAPTPNWTEVYNKAAELYYTDCDYDTAYEKLDGAEDSGCISAIKLKALCLQYGSGTEKDIRKALELYERAAELGDVEAMTSAAFIYESEAELMDYAKAFAWFSKAAEMGDRGAMSWLSVMYKEGMGVEKDAAKAAEWREKADAEYIYTGKEE